MTAPITLTIPPDAADDVALALYARAHRLCDDAVHSIERRAEYRERADALRALAAQAVASLATIPS